MTSIEWTDKTWNPVTGCTRISAGCHHCYAESLANRFWGDRKFSDIQFHEDRLAHPFSWKKPQKIFVNSMSDLFHDAVTDEQIDQVFAVMALTPQHIYQVLTKRPQRMLEYLTTPSRHGRILLAGKGNPNIPGGMYPLAPNFPLPNVWLGVTCENQKTADERIPLLLKTPAAVRFLSCEPLLEEVDLSACLHLRPCPQHRGEKLAGWGHLPCDCREFFAKHRQQGMPGIDQVIFGGESGPGARECAIEWIRSGVEQCREAGVSVFVKQLGNKPTLNGKPYKVTGKGNDFESLPEDLKIREFPKT